MVWAIDWFTNRFKDQVMTDDQLAVAEQTILKTIKADQAFQERLDSSISRAFEAGGYKGK